MLTIPSLLRTAVKSHADRTAVQHGTHQLTYQELLNGVTGMAQLLRSKGVTSDAKVVLLFENTPISALGFLALAWLNAAVIPLDPERASNHSLNLISDDVPFTAILGEFSKVGQAVQAAAKRDFRFIDIAEDAPITDLCSSLKPIGLGSVPSKGHFLYHYTSGSTGRPKAALHTQASLVRGGIIYNQTYELGPEDNIFVPIPLAHSFGLVGGLISSLVSGSKLILTERFVPRQLLDTLIGDEITVLIAVPFIYDLLARCYLRATPELSPLRICLSSGAPLPPATAEKFEKRYHKPIYEVYGTTETGVIAGQWPRGESWPQGSVGSPLKEVIVRIVDEEGRDLPAQHTGGLLVKNSTMFAGYHGHPDATAKAFKEGWYITGDTAWQDDVGHLYLSGRKNTFINVGGRKVNPTEVEEVLVDHPMINAAMVYGESAYGTGEQVHAAVVTRCEVSESELLEFCREHLASHEVPCGIDFVAQIPRTGLGKVRRGVCPAQFGD